MILIEATIKYKGYSPLDLKPYSRKRVCKSCDNCGRVGYIKFRQYRSLCRSCNNKLNPANLGKFGKDNPGWKQITLTCQQCGNEFTVKQSQKNKAKFCSYKCIGEWKSKNLVGENAPNYNINITNEERLIKRNYPEYKKWRKEVFMRDNYICQICGNTKLNAHHIESYANNKELRISLDNGITLCEDCHKNFHHIYGKGNNTKEQFIEFINRRI